MGCVDRCGHCFARKYVFTCNIFVFRVFCISSTQGWFMVYPSPLLSLGKLWWDQNHLTTLDACDTKGDPGIHVTHSPELWDRLQETDTMPLFHADQGLITESSWSIRTDFSLVLVKEMILALEQNPILIAFLVYFSHAFVLCYEQKHLLIYSWEDITDNVINQLWMQWFYCSVCCDFFRCIYCDGQ